MSAVCKFKHDDVLGKNKFNALTCGSVEAPKLVGFYFCC